MKERLKKMGRYYILTPNSQMPVLSPDKQCQAKSTVDSPMPQNSDDRGLSSLHTCEQDTPSLTSDSTQRSHLPNTRVKSTFDTPDVQVCLKRRLNLAYTARKRFFSSNEDKGQASNSPETSTTEMTQPGVENTKYNISCLSSSETCSISPETTKQSDKELHLEMQRLQNIIRKKEERLHNLKMVKIYRDKNNLRDLQQLVIKWRLACQDALKELLDASAQEQPCTMITLLQHLHIDPHLVNYDVDDDVFE